MWAAILLGAGCAHSRLPHAGTGAPVRHVLRASQYAITTDFPMEKSDPIVDELVTLRGELGDLLDVPLSREPVRIVIFESQQRFSEFLRLNYPSLPARRAFFVREGKGQMAVYAFRGERLRRDLRHEATHALLNARIPGVPIWLDEGLAEYFESMDANGRSRPEYLGALADDLADRRAGRPNLDRLETRVDLWQMSAADYRESWLWVHFCVHHSPGTKAALRAHLAALVAGRPDRLAPRLGKAGATAHADLRALVAAHLARAHEHALQSF